MRVPYFMQGMMFGPAFIGLTLILKAICPVTVGANCFADQLAIPIFLPLIFIYKLVGDDVILFHELWFIVFYWSLVGLLIGLIFDLHKDQSLY